MGAWLCEGCAKVPRDEAHLAFGSPGVNHLVHRQTSLPEGYKPRGNYQGLLATEVESFLDQRPGFLEQLAAAPTLNPNSIQQPPSLDLSQINVDPPEKIIAPSRTDKPWLSRKGKKIDFAEKNAADRRLASWERSSFTTWNGTVSRMWDGRTSH